MASIYDHNDDIRIRQSTTCQECGEPIIWRDSDYVGGSTEDDRFSSAIDKLIHHINNDPKCVRERKLKELLGTKEKLSQDCWLL